MQHHQQDSASVRSVKHHEIISSVGDPKKVYNSSSPACSARGVPPCRLHRNVSVPPASNCAGVGVVTASNISSSDNNSDSTACVPVATKSNQAGVEGAAGDDVAECHRRDENQATKLLGDKYLLLNLVEGSSLYRCVNVHSQQEMVCKVRQSLYYFIVHRHL